MRTDAFDYDLPAELIAQQPAPQRDQARMMVVNRATGGIHHAQVAALPAFLKEPDLLVVNDTRVIPARLVGIKEDTGGKVECLLLEEQAPQEWEVLVKASRRPAPGSRFLFADGRLRAVMLQEMGDGKALVRMECETELPALLAEAGRIPLPPYIRRPAAPGPQDDLDRERYQTVYAREPGAVAAPTAGLHFTPDLLDRLQEAGIETARITLHVGAGTFRPVTVEDIDQHQMESERFHVSRNTAEQINAARAGGGRIVAVGTTTVRTLETVWRSRGKLEECRGRSELFIYPPYTFGAVDALMTNFHLPKSTLLMMICAFGGYALMMKAYQTAVTERYRFYSYGDCMLIL